ncbi:MAG: DUF481 domain-containing protein [Planctomycetota bacterium]
MRRRSRSERSPGDERLCRRPSLRRRLRVGLAALLLVALHSAAFAQAPQPTPAPAPGPPTPGQPGSPVTDPFEPLPADSDAGTASTGGSGNGGSRVPTDRVYVDDGSVLEGTITGYSDGKFQVSSAALGEVHVHPDRVVRFSLARERLFYMQELLGTESRAVVLSVGGNGHMTVREANSEIAEPLDTEHLFRLSAVPIAASEWVGTLTGLLSADIGTTDTLTIGVNTSLIRESRFEYLELKFEFSFNQVENAVNTRLMQGNILYRFFLSDEFGAFAYDWARDDDQVGLRFGNHLLLGFTWRPIIDNRTSLLFDFGGGYSFEVRPTDEVQYATVMVGAILRHQVTENWSEHLELRYSWNIEDWSRYILQLNGQLLFALEEMFSLGFRTELYWQGRAPAGVDRLSLRLFGLVKVEIR